MSSPQSLACTFLPFNDYRARTAAVARQAKIQKRRTVAHMSRLLNINVLQVITQTRSPSRKLDKAQCLGCVSLLPEYSRSLVALIPSSTNPELLRHLQRARDKSDHNRFFVRKGLNRRCDQIQFKEHLCDRRQSIQVSKAAGQGVQSCSAYVFIIGNVYWVGPFMIPGDLNSHFPIPLVG
jgi:hypothetical protein